jgi:hypothetical protein
VSCQSGRLKGQGRIVGPSDVRDLILHLPGRLRDRLRNGGASGKGLVSAHEDSVWIAAPKSWDLSHV